jgi:hypothetical protein
MFLCSLGARIKIIGRHHVPDKGPYIVVINHFSYIDPVFVIHALRKPISFLAASDQVIETKFIWAPFLYGFIPTSEGFAFGMTYGLVGMLYISGSHMVVFFGTIFYLAALFSIERIFLRRGYITGSIFVSFIIFINIWGNMTWFFFFRFFFIAFFVYFMVKFFEALVLKRRSITLVK